MAALLPAIRSGSMWEWASEWASELELELELGKEKVSGR
jgi:hypothetical protein